ncbi:MAG TPA: DUF4012 domain-containing protein [Patescibacteria group bacterium]|nr:DUF4012 domain-containing protein [Patescibacteria group bacterium]
MDEKKIDIPEIKLPETPDTGFSEVSAAVPQNIKNEQGFVEIPNLKFKNNKKKKIIIRVAAVVLAIFVFLILATLIPGITVYKKAKVLVADSQTMKADFSKQDINLVQTDVGKFKTDLTSFQSSYNLLSWMKFMPFLSGYWNDGNHAINGAQHAINAGEIGIETAKPYADIIGFAPGGTKATNAEENANDRIQFLVSTIKDILPKVDQVSKEADAAKSEFDQIDPNRYPTAFAGKPIREDLTKGIDLIDEAAGLVANSKPLLQSAPYMMGIDSPRTYLVLFQNDKELRPTGGFITGYSIMTVDKGKVSNVTSNDIYNLDNIYTPTIKAPQPIIQFIKGPYVINPNLRLRDMNFDPDFKDSMTTFVAEAQKAGIPKIDGVIAVDTQVLVNILNVIGTVGVPGYGNFGTQINPKCNCPDVVYQLEDFADVEGSVVWDQNDPTKIIYAPANYYNRKAIIGPLMNSVLKNSLGQPKEKIPALFQAAWNSLTQKDVLFYMLDANAQQGVESFNIAGRVSDTPANDDYLFVDDANLGGRKSNLYVTNEVESDASIGLDGSITKTVTLTYKNSQGYDGWLNSVLPSWLRIYVPKGSTLISIDGLDNKQAPYEDLGKTVFAGSYSLRPLGVVTITVKYKLPFKAANGQYNLFVQKQSGVESIMETVKVGRQEQDTFLKSDQEFKFKI